MVVKDRLARWAGLSDTNEFDNDISYLDLSYCIATGILNLYFSFVTGWDHDITIFKIRVSVAVFGCICIGSA